MVDGQSNARPVIIKRKKIIQGGGHHGGAWKVAYADFVTAMMAFFMLMWLLNATTEQQRKGLADYFSPSIPISRVSGGGDGAMGGDSMFTKDIQSSDGTGTGSALDGDGGKDGLGAAELAEKQIEIEKMLAGRRGESMTMERALRHVVTKVTDEGLVIELFDLDDAPLFVGQTNTPQPIMDEIAGLLNEVLGLTSNQIAVSGHVRSFPITLVENPEWPLSAARAQAIRSLLEASGLPASRMQRISGFANNKPVTANPMAARNNRIEVILLRRDR
jgi:chemotaxis protein MotB